MIKDILECYDEETFLKADGFDGAIIGVDENSMRLIYYITLCLEILMNEGMDEDEADEHFSFNVQGAYMGEKTPIWCNDRF